MKSLKVSAANFNRKPGYYQDQAKNKPVIITRNGHEHVVMIDIAEYQKLIQNQQEAFSGELAVEDQSHQSSVS
jgi:prevent-host-death family protein